MAPETDGTPPSVTPRIAPVMAVVASIVWGFVGVVSLPMLMMSPMAFDAPGSEHNPYVWVVFASLLSLPILCAGSVVGGWRVLAVTRRWDATRASAGRRARVALALVPLVGVAGIVGGIVMIQVACHGSFACR